MLLGLFLIAVGVFCLWGALTQPSFFWESRKAQRLRRIIGDGGAKIFYLVLAIVIIVAGIVLGIMKVYEGKADKLYDQGKYEEGLGYYMQLHGIFKDDITYLNGISFGNYMLQNFDEAKEYAELSVSKNKEGNQDGSILLAWSLKQQDRLGEAIEALENYLANDSNDSFALSEIGKMYHTNNQSTEAIQSFKTAIEISPSDGSLYLNLAEIYYQNSQFENEIYVYDQMIAGNIEVEGVPHEDTYYKVYYGLGVSHYSLGNYEESKEYFTKSLEIDNSDADAWYFLASAQALLGDKDSAKESLRKTFELNSDYATVVKTDADFASMLQDEEVAKLIAKYAK